MIDSLRKRLARLVRRVRPRYGLRDSDVLLASYPKSGNTWVRFIWANVVALAELGGKTVDFHVLNRELGAEYDNHHYGRLEFEVLPRLVKTHREYSERAFGGNRSVYLYRHPGDVMVSYYHYLAARKDALRHPDDVSEFLRDEEHGLPAWCRHVAGWTQEADALLSYRELQEGAPEAMGRVLRELGIEGIPPTLLGTAAERSSFEELRTLERERSRPGSPEFEDGYRFMRSGSVGEWREHLDRGDRQYLREMLGRYGLPQRWSDALGTDEDR